ncbi:hypothetical protein M569_00071 [Genlisea aurea]|uniref:Uncharacterized protein n=1 Tax=Genlisea aurea TaxID=192259 RepID=S8DB05_9LAMI|nr:hypothetical protein M569_00071 [Genlisea aurea]
MNQPYSVNADCDEEHRGKRNRGRKSRYCKEPAQEEPAWTDFRNAVQFSSKGPDVTKLIEHATEWKHFYEIDSQVSRAFCERTTGQPCVKRSTPENPDLADGKSKPSNDRLLVNVNNSNSYVVNMAIALVNFHESRTILQSGCSGPPEEELETLVYDADEMPYL